MPTPALSAGKTNGAPPGAPTIAVRSLWKVFGPAPERVITALESGATKSDVLGQTGAVVAVRDVSFEVQKGETFVVMGLSGSGKSTLLRCLPRLIEPTRGRIAIDGRDVGTLDAQALRELRRHRVSMVFQHFGLLPHRRIIDNVAYGLEVQGVKRNERYAKAREVLEIVNLQGWEHHYPSQLSGGMQQRVGLARALAVDPEILLFDEPFSALDPLIRREMQDELLSIQARLHCTLVFITHDFAEAIKLGTHIAIMKDGRFVQVGTAEQLVMHPADAYVAEFARDVPKSRVLRARSIMEPLDPAATLGKDGVVFAGTPVAAATPLDRCIALVLQKGDAPLPVIDEAGGVIGRLTRQSLLQAMNLDTHSPA